MNIAILIFSAMLLATAVGTEIHKNRDKTDSGELFEFHLIGTEDGVTFYFDTRKGNWTTAKTYCKSFGLELANINTKSQLNMLTSSTLLPYGGYWTAGRDADEVRQFTWDDTKQPVPDLLAAKCIPLTNKEQSAYYNA